MKSPGVVATVVGMIGLAIFTGLLFVEKIGTAAYLGLLTLLVFTCLVIPVLERLKTLDAKNLKITLEKIESVKREIYAKEADLQKTSLILAELIAATATISGMWGSEESEKYKNALVRTKILLVAKQVGLSTDDIAEIFKYERARDAVRNAPKDERDKVWNDFVELLKREAERID